MPNTVNAGFNIPNTGDFVGAWGTTVINNNMIVIDGVIGGAQMISLTNANVSLTIATGSIGTGSLTPGAGPTQSANKKITFAGTLSGNCTITFPRPGDWIVNNACTLGGFSVLARASGTGNIIGLPPGESVHVFCDGTNMEFCDLGRVGEFMDLAVATTPAWMSSCSILPYLPCVGTATYSASVYLALAAMLGSTHGGNGITTFGVPDLRGRYRIPLDGGAGRVTSAGSGIDGATLGASGGAQNQTISTAQMPAHTHVLTDPGHIHTLPSQQIAPGGGGGGVVSGTSLTQTVTVNSHTTGITIGTTGGTSPLITVPPALVFGMTFLKT